MKTSRILNYAHIILVVALFISCNKNQKENNKQEKSDSYTFSLTKATEEDFEKAKSHKAVLLISDSSILTYRNESICFPSTCLDSICLRPSLVDPIPVKQEYKYLGFLKTSQSVRPGKNL